MSSIPLAWWMRTKLGQWLATNVHFFAFLWRRNMDRELAAVAAGELQIAKQRLIECADDYIGDTCGRGELVAAACSYRNARERWRKLQTER